VNGQISTPPSALKKAAGKAVTGTKAQGFFYRGFLQEFFIKNGQVLFLAVKLKIIGTCQKVLPRTIPSHLQAYLRTL